VFHLNYVFETTKKVFYRHQHVVATVEEVSQGFLETCEVKVLAEQPISDAVPEAAVGVVVGVLAELDDVGSAQHLGLELDPVDLRSLSVQLKLTKF
jgi:hypothetical protein